MVGYVAAMSDASPRRDALTPFLVAAAAAWFTWRCAPSWTTVVDDAFISARYAEMLVTGRGLTYSADAPAVEGVTNLTWTLLLALGRAFGAPIVPWMTGLGWACGVAAIALAAALARTLGATRPGMAALPAWWLALSPHLAAASTNGLESSLMVAAVLGATLAALRDRTPARWVAGSTVLFLLWTRPEGAVVAALLVAHGLWQHRGAWREAVPLAAWAAGGLGSLTALRLALFGMPLPNTYYAKQDFALSRTWQINDQYLLPDAPTLLTLAGVVAVGAVVRPWRGDRALASIIALVLGLIPFTVYLWMPGLRLFLPSLALAAVALGSAVGAWRAAWGVPAGIATTVAWGALGLSVTEPVRAYDGRHSVLPDNGTEQVARFLASRLPDGAWLATRDAGVFAYWIGPHVHVAELHHRALTRAHPGGADTDPAVFTPTNPEVIVVTQRRAHTTGFVYQNDRKVLLGTTAPYHYLGRVYQHFHRYYDVYARADLGVTALPSTMVVSRAGPAPPVPAAP